MNISQLLLALCCFVTPHVFAQADDIEADRPGRSTGTSITLTKALQLETGLRQQYDRKEGEQQNEYLYPTLLVRYGLGKKLELRVVVENERDYEFVPEKQQTAHGLTPVRLGLKYSLWQEKSTLPAASILARTAMPHWASPDFEGTHLAPAFVLLMNKSITKKLSMTYNVGVEWETDDAHAHYLYTFNPQLALTDKWKAFVELYGLLFRRDVPKHSFDGGLLFLATSNLQFDVSAGLALSHAAPNAFLELGCSVRWPHK